MTVAAELSAKRVWAALAEVPDPEIPVISVVDLGDGEGVEVDAHPPPLNGI